MIRSFVQFTLLSILVNFVSTDNESRSGHFPGSVFWPPYTSHLLQSTKAQSKNPYTSVFGNTLKIIFCFR